MPGTITREGEDAVIRLPMAEVHELRVSLQPCTCKMPKAKAGMTIRDRIEKGLAMLQGVARG